MATATLQDLKDLYTRYLGTGPSDAAVQSFQSSPTSYENILQNIASSPEYQARAQTLAQNQYQPQLSALDVSQNNATNQYDQLIQSLKDRQQQLPEQILGQFSRRGLFRSGLSTDALQQGLVQNNNSLVNAQMNRADRLAALAAQRANLILQQQNTTNQYLNQPIADLQAAQKQQAANTVTVKAGGRTLLVNKLTGQTVADLGASGSGSTSTTTGVPNGLTRASLNTASKGLLASYDVGGPNQNVDYNSADSGDKLLSHDQATAAYNGILDLVGGNETLATSLFNNAVISGGYKPYGDFKLVG